MMEEASNTESIRSEPGGKVADKNQSTKQETVNEKSNEEEKLLENKNDEVVTPKETNVSVEQDTNVDDEFEQISDGTFELDENSQATSAGGGGAGGVEESTTKSNTTEKSCEDEEQLGSSAAEFEAVNANLSTNADSTGASANEADMLGESDMTLPATKDATDDNAQDEPLQSRMDVDEDESATDAPGDSEENAKEDDNSIPADVDMDSVNNSLQEGDVSRNEDDDDKQANESMEADTTVEMKTKPAENENSIAQEEAEKDETSKETVKEKDKQDEKSDKVAVEEEQQPDNEQESETEQEQEAAESEAVADIAEAGDNFEKDNETVEDDAEGEDQSVENVQEPEESDVCLIPDDTETEMTEAEKEQAILARENAEKEADAEEAEKEKQNEAAKRAAQEEADNEAGDESNVAGDNAQAAEAGAESVAAGSGSEETPPNTEGGDAPDPDEPLLEELQTNASKGGTSTKTIISWIVSASHKCIQCNVEKPCGYRFKNPEKTETGGFEYICEPACCTALMAEQPGKYFIRRKKFLVEEINNESDDDEANAMPASDKADHQCLQCKDGKSCKYFFKQDDDFFFICNDDCFNLLNAEEPDKFKLKRHSIRVRNIGATISNESSNTKRQSSASGAESRVVARTAAEAESARLDRLASFTRRCADCFNEITLGDKNLVWEAMDFCNEMCLGKYQRSIGSTCQTCHGEVPHQALGKYCVRFGFYIRQFCCAACLNEFKKGFKTCSCCQKDISAAGEGFLAPVGDKEQFKDFCSQSCMRRYDSMCNPKKKLRSDTCAVCNNEKPVRVEIILDGKEHTFCSNPCFSAFQFVSNIVSDQCGMCNKYFERKTSDANTIYTDRRPKVFCSRICLSVFIVINRRIVSCQWCKVKKYNFDMIYKQQEQQEIFMCSLNCLTLYGVSINAFSRAVAKCDNCNASATPQYHLTMSDASMRNFCTYQCVMQFQSQFARAPLTLDTENATTAAQPQQATGTNSTNPSKNNNTPFPTGLPKRVKLKVNQQKKSTELPTKPKTSTSLPVISTVSSLASGETMIGNVTVRRSRVRGRKMDSPPPLAQLSALNSPGAGISSGISGGIQRGRPRKNIDYRRSPSPTPSGSSAPSTTNTKRVSNAATQPSLPVQTETKIITVPPYPPTVRNVQTSCKPQTVTVGFQCEPKTSSKEIQTEKDYSNKVLIPVPVPIYVPQPMYMYSAPFPVPVPIPLPIPVPIFIPTTRNSAQGIMKEIKKIQDKMPADPFEAELLMMAEMVAEEKHVSDSDSDDEIKPDPALVTLQYQNSIQQQQQQHEEVANNSYGEDVLQMALKMATGDYDQPPTHHSTVDLESAMTANTISNPPPNMAVAHDSGLGHMNAAHHIQPTHHIMEPQRSGRGRKRGSTTNSPISPRNSRSPVKRARLQELEPQITPEPVQSLEKPDANMCLKYTFGVNAWKQWVMTKNADLEKSSMSKRLFKTELLQMTADELNFSLCLFVKEVRKPNGTEYAPDTIYYLVLGIQQYLYENGRIDNIFTDPYYERFTDCLDEVARKFSVLYNDSQYIVTRVEEEHLWECKQLGAHSPHVLLSTLMFFNTKHFNLTTVEEHMQLSFSHIMKHWKRSAQGAKTPGTRNVLLRFYPPQAGLDANPRKKKVYEQQENEENPLRCPVRLYEFYLSKCPESVKTRNDVFYLQPERSCVPDSPVWYSTQALSQEALQKMLHRVKMVKEINIALLTS